MRAIGEQVDDLVGINGIAGQLAIKNLMFGVVGWCVVAVVLEKVEPRSGLGAIPQQGHGSETSGWPSPGR
jgi:hypothetical protein